MKHLATTNPIDGIKHDICKQIGVDHQRPPLALTPEQTAQVLGINKSTLSIWRSVGRYNLPYQKSGRLVRYPLNELAKFIANSTYGTASNEGG